jgi:Cys-rich repeat protein
VTDAGDAGSQEQVERMTYWRRLAFVALMGFAGCGELHTPDFAHGSIAGRVVGAQADGFAYPLGHPELATPVAGDGSFRFDGQPAGAVQVVVYDDTLVDGSRRAELVSVVVPGAGVARFLRNGENAPVALADKMAWAGAVVASVSPAGGGLAVGARFAVEGTTLARSAPTGSVVRLGLLPAATGVYRLTASADGYKPATRPIDVASATNGYDVPLEIDTDGSGPIGCNAVGGGCVNGLKCEASTGRCVQCLADADCATGSTCDLAEHFCTAPPLGDPVQGPVCASCSSDTQCQGGPENPGRCETSGATTGYCTWVPVSSVYCPAGFQFLPDDMGVSRCVPAVSCEAYFAEFGHSCFADEDCVAGGELAGAICYGADPAFEVPGYCTAECRVLTTPADSCMVPGFHCDPSLKYCLRNLSAYRHLRAIGVARSPGAR